MRPRPFLLLLAGFALALMAAGEADAGKEPVWSYETLEGVTSVAISADGSGRSGCGRTGVELRHR